MTCLYFGDPDECQNCGGFLHNDDASEPLVTDIGNYCSDECFDEAVEAHARWRP